MSGERMSSVPGGVPDGERMPGPALEARHLRVAFATETGTVLAVDDVSLEVHPGETLALVGESGSGKSTIALAALRLLPATARIEGEMLVAGDDVAGLDERELSRLRGRTVSMVFQEPATALDPLMRVGDQVAEVITNHQEISRAEARDEAVLLLERVGIPDPAERARSFPFQLSGGQRQRVVIAMAIANRPSVLVADEPTTALDVTVQAEILDLVRRISAEDGMAVLLVTHNMGVVADIADRVTVLNRGRVVETGTVEGVLGSPREQYTRELLAAVPRLRVAGDAGAVSARPDGSKDDSARHAATHTSDPGELLGTVRDVPGGAAATPAAALHDVTVAFGRGSRRVLALDGVDLAVPAGQTLGLVGESGSGKSTAARVVLGLIRPTSGTVELLGEDVRHLRGRRRRELLRGIGVVLQDPAASLDPRMSVEDAVAEPLLVHRKELGRRDRERLVTEAIERVRLDPGILRRSPGELSGGQRQRVSLARALVLGPRLLVADEPTSALDVSVQRTVLETIRELQRELGFACLFVSHDLAVVQDFASSVVVLRHGRVVEQGPTSVTLTEPDDPYTRALLAAVPVPDPAVQHRRRDERAAVLAARES